MSLDLLPGVPREPEQSPLGKRLLVAAGGLLGTGAILWAVLLLGSWAYDYRRLSYHEGRLARLVEKKPALDLVVLALEQDGSPLVDAARGEEDLRRAAARWGPARTAEILAKGERWTQARVFRAGDVVYFLYFDAAGLLRDYTCVDARGQK